MNRKTKVVVHWLEAGAAGLGLHLHVRDGDPVEEASIAEVHFLDQRLGDSSIAIASSAVAVVGSGRWRTIDWDRRES